MILLSTAAENQLQKRILAARSAFWSFGTAINMDGFKRRNFVATCTDGFDVPADHDHCPKDSRGDASEPTAVFLLKEQPVFSVTHYSSLNQWFEIYSTFEVLLIYKELNYQGTVLSVFHYTFHTIYFL